MSICHPKWRRDWAIFDLYEAGSTFADISRRSGLSPSYVKEIINRMIRTAWAAERHEEAHAKRARFESRERRSFPNSYASARPAFKAEDWRPELDQ